MGCTVSANVAKELINHSVQTSPKRNHSSLNSSKKLLLHEFDRSISITIMSKPNKTSNCSLKNKTCPGSQSQGTHPTLVSFAKFQVLETPVKSESDKKEYKVIQLENGLRACLIADKSPFDPDSGAYESETDTDESSSTKSGATSSCEEESDIASDGDGDGSSKKSTGPEQKMAAAGLCIGVGSFSDPKEVPGMAHFLEHMLFMGSEKFPAENDFDSFIKKGGGSDNASTDTETTVIYFECLEKNLHEALDKFSQFFISPLMKREAMTREREAIDSEFQMAVPSDSSRKEQLLCSVAKADSPVNSFTWGNLISLRDNITDDELYKGVHEFRKRHYSAHRMTLAIQARLPLEDLESYVLECFSKVPNNGLPPDDFSKYSENVFSTPAFTRMYYIKPVKDLCQVDLTWALPSLRDKYKSKPHQYISYLMGDEGKGSLLSFLKKKVWVLGTSIGNGESGSEHNSMFTLFTVSMVLTKEGLDHLYEVIETVFAYINMLKEVGPQQRIFDEIKTISDMSFRFATEDTAVDIVEDLCEEMQFYPPEDYIAGSQLYYEFDPEGIKMVLDFLNPSAVNIMVLATNPPENIKYDKVEKWFGTEYTDKEIPQGWIKKWEEVKPYPELSVPPPNVFLTKDFSLLSEQHNNPEYPTKVLSTPLVEMWYRKDQKFKLPIAHYNFYLISSMALENVKNACMLDMLANLLIIDLAEEIYPASSADLEHGFKSYEKGVILKVYGYNEKLPILLNLIVKHLTELSSKLENNMFDAVKDKLVKFYYNRMIKPSIVAKDLRLKLLTNGHWVSSEKYSTMLDVTFEDMKKFSDDFLKVLYVKSLVQGNVSVEVAQNVVNEFVSKLNYKELAVSAQPKFRVVEVPKGEVCCRIKCLNPNDSNSIITNYYQSGPYTNKGNCILEILQLIIEEPLFDILRTKEQLGYHVYCSIRDTFGILGYTVTVNAQATKNTTQYVDQRIEEFMKHTKKLLNETDEDDLKSIKNDLIKMKRCADVHLAEEVDRNWSEIISDDYIFDRLEQEIQAIEKVELKELKKWWEEHNSFGNKANFKKLSIQIVGHGSKEKEVEKDSPEEKVLDVNSNLLGSKEDAKNEKRSENYFIGNIETFKEKLYLYPVITKTQ